MTITIKPKNEANQSPTITIDTGEWTYTHQIEDVVTLTIRTDGQSYISPIDARNALVKTATICNEEAAKAKAEAICINYIESHVKYIFDWISFSGRFTEKAPAKPTTITDESNKIKEKEATIREVETAEAHYKWFDAEGLRSIKIAKVEEAKMLEREMNARKQAEKAEKDDAMRSIENRIAKQNEYIKAVQNFNDNLYNVLNHY